MFKDMGKRYTFISSLFIYVLMNIFVLPPQTIIANKIKQSEIEKQ